MAADWKPAVLVALPMFAAAMCYGISRGYEDIGLFAVAMALGTLLVAEMAVLSFRRLRVMAFQSHRRAAIVAFVAAVVFGGCAWHFASREAAYWSTDGQITETELRRAGMLSEVFGCAAAVAGVSAVGFTVLCVRTRMHSVAHYHFLRCAVFVAMVCSACIGHHFSELILGMDAHYPAERIVRFIAHELCAIGFVPVLVISVLLGMLPAALIGRSRERDA